MKKSYVTFLAGLGLGLPAIFYYFRQTGFDNVLYPHPILVLVPMLLGFRWAAFAVPAVGFFLWNRGLFRGEEVVPRRSPVLLIILACFSALWFAVGRKDGMAIQGAVYCRLVFSANIVCIGILSSMFAYSKKIKSFAINLLCHWILFLWLSWYAFPFFGEIL